MELSQEVISLELAKELKKIGVLQRSIFYWDIFEESYDIRFFTEHSSSVENYSAFTIHELMELIPNTIETKKDAPFYSYRFNITRSIIVEEAEASPIFIVNYHCEQIDVTKSFSYFGITLFKNIWDKNLANSLAKTFIYLFENGFININGIPK